ncbi:DUF2283 domain-containing protein [Arthrobacter sp.]|uniref:DUF2283 domain-containing protein n=1 Tax=Arthrobacter sp. TaxID=1667 RepID=UPI002811E4F9|nr:DUF2283 domain-containing protein [Arthrobacter sp.]
MRIRYDASVDAAYIYLADEIWLGNAAKTYPCDPIEVDGMINLDFNSEGRLIGIQVLSASAKLPPELLKLAEKRQSP